MQTELTIPDKLEPLLQPKRYKVVYGGRGSAKSWTVARILLALGATRCLRVLCCREIQKSISESVHQLLRDQIEALGLSHHYTITANAIVGKNGTQFFFAGLKHNIDSIKSKEGIDVVWVEEAHSVSKRSWEKLIPTIRKPGSEIWVVFNPELDTDDTWRRFIVNGANDPRVLKILMNWRDNDWFTGELEAERIALRQSDPDGYLTVYEGHCRQTLEGAIYAKELRAAQAEGRITTVPYDRSMPVFTAWDLGFRDRTSIWFVQMIGFQYRIIDFCEAQRTSLEDWLKLLQQRGYLYDTHFLPHDGDNESMASRSIATLMRNANHKVDHPAAHGDRRRHQRRPHRVSAVCVRPREMRRRPEQPPALHVRRPPRHRGVVEEPEARRPLARGRRLPVLRYEPQGASEDGASSAGSGGLLDGRLDATQRLGLSNLPASAPLREIRFGRPPANRRARRRPVPLVARNLFSRDLPRLRRGRRPQRIGSSMATRTRNTAPKKNAPPASKRKDGAEAKTVAADKVLDVALKRYQRCEDKDRDNRLEGYDDLAFLAGDQWDAKAKAARGDRPMLQINRLPQFVEQVTGDMRQMRPSIKCVAVDDRGDPKTAEVIAGMVRYIENRSSASEGVYPDGADSQVQAGIGHWKVCTEYADDSTFEQEIRIEPVSDQLAVRWDPDSILKDRSDAMYCFEPEDMARERFEEEYPDARPTRSVRTTRPSFTIGSPTTTCASRATGGSRRSSAAW
jgi:phage terminase large subunit